MQDTKLHDLEGMDASKSWSSHKFFTKEAEALKALLDYEWTKTKT